MRCVDDSICTLATGIPTFRGIGGLWRKYDAIGLATPQAFKENKVNPDFYIINSTEISPGYQTIHTVGTEGVTFCIVEVKSTLVQ